MSSIFWLKTNHWISESPLRTLLYEISKVPGSLTAYNPTQDPSDPAREFEERKRMAEQARVERVEKASYVESEVVPTEPEEQYFYGPFWRKCDYTDNNLFCPSCQTDAIARQTNTQYQWNCIRRSADSYAPQQRYSVEDCREARLELAARINAGIHQTGMGLMNLRSDTTKWLVALADRLIGNKCYIYGERLMKAVSHVGEVRLPSEMAEELCKSRKMRQVNVTMERSYNTITDETEEFFRIGKDFGNVAYKSYVMHLLATQGNLNESKRQLQQPKNAVTSWNFGWVY